MANIIKNVSSPCPAARPPTGDVTRPSHHDLPLCRDIKQCLSAHPDLSPSLGIPHTPGCLLPLWHSRQRSWGSWGLAASSLLGGGGLTALIPDMKGTWDME